MKFFIDLTIKLRHLKMGRCHEYNASDTASDKYDQLCVS